jgi:MFS family permease
VSEFSAGWRALAASLVGAGCGIASISFYSSSVFIAAISEDMGWPRGSVQIGVSIMILSAMITAPITGALVDKYGPRQVALVSVPLYAAALGIFGYLSHTLTTFYLAWLIISFVGAGTLPITWTKNVNLWFDTNRGLALGICLMGTGIAATLVPVYAVSLISVFGWKQAYVFLGITVLVIALPSTFYFFRVPEGHSHQDFLAKTPQPKISNSKVLSRSEVKNLFSDHRFWLIGVSILLIAAAVSAFITSLIPLLMDRQMSLAAAASYAGYMGLSVIGGRIFAGILIDRAWAPAIAAAFFIMPAISAIVLLSATGAHDLTLLAILGIGLAAGAELDLMAFLISRYFKMEQYGYVYGWIYVFFSLGAGTAPAIAGWNYSLSSSYQSTLMTISLAASLSAAAILCLGPYPVRSKE